MSIGGNGNGRRVTAASQAFSFSRRAWLLGMAQGGVGLALAGRMGWLAVAENARFSALSESNRVNSTLMPPRRGWIVDRHGAPIANNRTSFRVDIIPDRLQDRERVLAELARLLSLTPEQVARIGVDLDAAAGFQPVQVADKLEWERFAAVNVQLPELPGVAPSQTFARHYPAGAAVAHLSGYVGAATAEQYKKTRDPLLVVPGFKLGKDGLEKTLEDRLRGQPGAKRAEVTARGKLIATLETRTGTPGQNQRLTIDAGLQEYTARRLGTNSGSAVVLDCQTGEILAMVSMPAYDPNSFSDGISHLEWNMLSADDHIPLMNKVTQGLYPPGSTVKPMHALALQEAGISPQETVLCTGSMRVGTGVFHCHKRGGHGHVNMTTAIAQSCDIYFFEQARRIGYDRFAPVARAMGLEQRFDLPLAAQRFGTVPGSAWKQRHYKTRWTVADSINASIGQGYVLANPLQLAVMAARIASGRAVEPSLLADRVHANPPALPYSPEHLAVIRAGMDAVVNGGGTGGVARLLVPGVRIAAKTGTAQVRRITMAERRVGVLKNASLPFRLRDHALFVCFAPVEAPRYAAAVVLEHGGHTVRALDTPGIGRDIITWLLDRKRAEDSLAALEPEWGGDIATRMTRQWNEYRAAQKPTPAVEATKNDGVVPSDSPTVERATDQSDAQAASVRGGEGAGNSIAEEGTTERDE